MLEALEQVDWGQLTHAYGTAEDVPVLIRDLRDPDATTRQNAINHLFNTIFHQGSRYRASAPAVPFLFEVLEAPDTQGKEQILLLLEHLAVGYPENHLGHGFAPDKAFARAERLGRRVDLAKLRAAEPQEKDQWDLGRQNLWEKDAYEAVLQRIDCVQRLTRDSDKPVRIEAVRTLAWFPAVAASSIAYVRGTVHSRSDPEELANAIHCLAILGHYLKDRSDVPWLRTQLAPEQPFLVRVTAAISLAILLKKSLPTEAIDVLLEMVQYPEKAQPAGQDVSWHCPGLLSEAVEVIKRAKPKPTEPIVAALCQAAERVEDAMSGVDVFYALLTVTFPPPKELPLERNAQGLPYLNPAHLTPNQWRALQAIGRSKVWQQEPFFYGRLMDLGLEYGLPWHPKPFADYLAGAEHALGNPNDRQPTEHGG